MSLAATLQTRRAVKIRRGLTLPVLLLVLWEVSSRTGLVDARFLPSLEDVFLTAKRELIDNNLFGELGFSLFRNIAGFFIGSVIGILFATLLALSRTADALITPTFNGLKQISLLAWIPLISIWFGFGEQAKIVFVAIAAFIPVVLNTYEGMRNAPRDLIEVGHALKFTPAAAHYAYFSSLGAAIDRNRRSSRTDLFVAGNGRRGIFPGSWSGRWRTDHRRPRAF